VKTGYRASNVLKHTGQLLYIRYTVMHDVMNA